MFQGPSCLTSFPESLHSVNCLKDPSRTETQDHQSMQEYSQLIDSMTDPGPSTV
uniref:Uncharacterized protein n=1 Tax=Arundo donax TaxID=35708 RepID=A0A0A9BS69_ARUDO